MCTVIAFVSNAFTARTASVSVLVIVAQPFGVLHHFVTRPSVIERSLVISRPTVICINKTCNITGHLESAYCLTRLPCFTTFNGVLPKVRGFFFD